MSVDSASNPRPLRSHQWLDGDDEVAILHRAALRSVGLSVPRRGTGPVIGIANSASDLNPCNLPFADLIERVADGVRSAGGIPVVFPTISLGEDLMKPSAMLYRNLLAMEIEETLRSYPLDGAILLVNCDKTVPGAVMGAVSADLPSIVFNAGARKPARFRGRLLGSGTDLWRLLNERMAGTVDDDSWEDLEACLSCNLGACNTMGTAASMAIMTEALGLALPGTGTIPVDDPARQEAATLVGGRAVQLVEEDLRPSAVLSPAAFRNAVRVLHSIGGSTNAVIHLLAIAGRAGVSLSLTEMAELGYDIPVLADVQPSGEFLIQDFHRAGGARRLMALLRDELELDAISVSGRSWRSELADPAQHGAGLAIRPPAQPLRRGGAFAVVSGNLAPNGAVIKTSAASQHLLKHRGPALVFRSYHEMRKRINDPQLNATPDTVLVLAGAGPVGGPGMPEWGMIPIPARLAAAGVTDMVRVTDARMSGTSFGTCILHVSPEAAVGGPLALVIDGDYVSVDVDSGTIELEVADAELARRRASWSPEASPHLRGWPLLYQRHVMQADTGCDLDFLRPSTPEQRSFVQPIVGRS